MPQEHRVISGILRLSLLVAGVVVAALVLSPLTASADESTSLAPYRHGGSVDTYFDGITYDPSIPTPAPLTARSAP